jgi:DNA-3-methyladenine glycosylase II
MARGFDLITAAAGLADGDRRLADWIGRLGPLAAEPRWRRPFGTVDALARAILYQQLSGKAAATIVGRVELAAGQRLLDAAALDAVDDLTLRGCGVSGNKLLALRDLVRRERAGQLPSPRQMARMDDDAIVDALSAVRGIGRWTAEMLLIFRLGRPDVLPLDDLGVRKGLQIVDGLDALPNARQLAQRGEPWRPYRTLASLYLWRVADTRVPA